MSCDKFRNEIEEMPRGNALAAGVSAHVASCESCRAFRVERERVRGLVAELARVEAPADFEFRLRARIARATDASHAASTRRTFVPGGAWLAVAGCLVLTLGLVVHFRAVATQEGGRKARSMDFSQQLAGANHATPEQGAAHISDKQTNTARGANAATTSQTLEVKAVNEFQPEIARTSGANEGGVKRANRTRASLGREKLVLSPEVVEQMADGRRVPAQLDSHSIAVNGSPIYYGAPIPLPVASSERKLEALYRDARGAQRVIAIDPVTFGAREQTQRTNVRDVSYTGIW